MKVTNTHVDLEYDSSEFGRWLYSIDELSRKHQRPFYRRTKVAVRQAQATALETGNRAEILISTKRFLTWDNKIIFIGGIMENLAEQLKAINMEVESAKNIIGETYNDVRSIQNAIEPEIYKIIKDIRQMRMTVVTELQTSLAMLKDIRKFFLESDYVEEIKRLNQFVGTISELKKLKDDGTLDAIADTILTLSEGREKK
jgi:hypothetical protein